jgi:PRD1 phage membrane DNA delivery
MGDELVRGIITVLTAIIGVAIIAALVSNKASTANVLTAGGNAFSNALGTAVGPITGYTPSTSGLGIANGGVQLPTLQ